MTALAANPFVPVEMRICIRCLTAKPVEGFYFIGSSVLFDGTRQRASYCKPCNHLRCKETSRQRRVRLREIVDLAKMKPCADCGREYPPCAMDLDQVRGEKKGSVGYMVSHNFSEETILDEIAKCDVRCAVCHRIRHFGGDS